ncbi:MAG: RagB/SusD family nutrient uptake outer membrane protein [Chitinophagaceae bacterium]
MNKRISSLILPLVLLSTFSCKKLIEIKESDFIDADLALKTVSQNDQAVIGAYASFGPEMDVRFNGVFSDELKPGDFYASTSVHEWQYTPNDIGIRDNFTATTAYYYVIDKVNRVLKALPNAQAVNATDEALRAKVKGDALFLRAFCHFELFRYYCGNYSVDGLGMPYVEEPSLESKARIPMGEYFQKMERDITDAKALLPDNLADVNRATRMAAVGLQARMALYKRDWPGAVTFATEYINAIPLSTGADFQKIWTDAGNAEVALKIKRNTGNTRLGSWFRGLFTKNATTGALVAPASITWVPSQKLWDTYDQANDIRFGSYLIDEPILQAVSGKPSKILKKYAGTGYATTNENVADVKLFRTAEMYLIRAEARAEQGTFTGVNSAESDINALRAARITGYTNVTFASKEQAISETMLERYKELALEGHRFWDLKRRSLPIERLASDAPTPAGQTLSANNFRFVLPIPQAEMLANTKMVQNPGYAD